MRLQGSSADSWRHERFAPMCHLFEGVEAIYTEPQLIVHVRLSQVSFDDWGVKATITDLLNPGMHRVPRNPFQFGVAWQIFSFAEGHWDTPAICLFRLRAFFDPKVIHAAKELAAEKSRNGETISPDDFRAICSVVLRSPE